MPAQAREWQTKRDCSSLVDQAIPPFTPEKRQQILLQCEIAEEFRAFVGERQSCTQDADCVPYSTASCTLPRVVPVAVRFAEAVEAKQVELTRRAPEAFPVALCGVITGQGVRERETDWVTCVERYCVFSAKGEAMATHGR